MEKTFENWLVVSDIDGTLNNKIRKLPKRNYDAIKKFTDLGGNFTLASGRLQSSLERNYNRITDKRQTPRSCLFIIGEKYGNQSKTEKVLFFYKKIRK